MGYSNRLAAREAETGRPVRVGLAGAGQMGSGFVAQVQRITGLEIGAIADVDPNRAISAYKAAGVDPDVDGGARHAVLTDAAALAQADVDMVVDATGVPDVGAALTLGALRAGKHVGLLNVECDVTIGFLLAAFARNAGKIYTLCRGDEPAEAVRLVEFARDLAFEVVAAGKGKNNPLNPEATPDSLLEEATSKHMNPKMLCSFVDGSKAMIEMAALANGADLQLTKRGMNGPAATVPTLAEIFVPEADGGVLPGSGYVDYCTGPVAPGVFVIVKAEDPVVHEEMSYLKMGPGPYFSLYRPYHQASIAPIAWNAEVGAAAKRDLQPGDKLDGIGGTTVYGMIESADVFAQERLLPLGLVGGARITRPVAKGELLSYDDVEWDRPSIIRQLRELQDRQIAENWTDAQTAAEVDHAIPS